MKYKFLALSVVSVGVLFLFQNCSDDVNFDTSRSSTAAVDGNVTGDGSGTGSGSGDGSGDSNNGGNGDGNGIGNNNGGPGSGGGSMGGGGTTRRPLICDPLNPTDDCDDLDRGGDMGMGSAGLVSPTHHQLPDSGRRFDLRELRSRQCSSLIGGHPTSYGSR